MTLSSLIDPALASDSGGVAGRIGYDFQAHVSAAFVLDMIADPHLIQIECETADDITLRWLQNGTTINEYVQVKTTDAEAKWGIKELTDRVNAKIGSSLVEKSLACDAHPGVALFRFVSTRDVRGDLIHFKIRREDRTNPSPRFTALVASFGAKHKTFKSLNGLTTRDWAQNMLWDVEPSEGDLERKNILKLLRLAEDAGERPSSRLSEQAYDELLKRVSTASKASRVTAPHAKALPRADALTWWENWLARMRADGQRSLKVYSVIPDAFFIKIADIDENAIRRSMQAFDAEFDGGTWRRDELARYLGDLLPEITLPPKVLASFTHLEARALTSRALEALAVSPTISMERLVAEIMLNAILRKHRRGEPIACKLFTKSAGIIHSNSAYIVHTSGVDEVWLGQARLANTANHASVVSEILAQIEDTLDRNVLKREREVIVQLRDPNHLRATNVERALSKNAKLDDFLEVLRVPILVAYDSDTINEGYKANYLVALKLEVESAYALLKERFPDHLKNVHIGVFLIPVECIASLTASFGDYLHGK